MVDRNTFRSTGPRDLFGDDSGVSALVVGLSMTALIGFAGLAVDVGMRYADKRNLQSAADAAAFSAAKDIYAGDTVTGAKTNAQAVTAQYGLTNGQGGVTVTVNNPPATGPNTANASAIEVIVSKSESLFFTNLFQRSASVAARAVATSGSAGAGAGGGCVVAFQPTTGTGLNLSNGVTIDLTACGAYVNTPGTAAVSVVGGATLKAKTLSVVGSITSNNGGTITVSGSKTTGASALADPYASVATPTAGTCNGNSGQFNGSQTINPGTYCSGISFNYGTITMNPGVYILNGGTFNVAGGSTVTGSGVTVVLTGSGSTWATATIANGTTVTFSAPASGATSGLVFMQNRNTPVGKTTINFQGGTSLNITGAMYFPTSVVDYANGSTNNSTCTQLLAYSIVFAGGARFGNTCTGVGVAAIGGTSSATALVE